MLRFVYKIIKRMQNSTISYLLAVSEEEFKNRFNSSFEMTTYDSVKDINMQYQFVTMINVKDEVALAKQYRELVDSECSSLYFQDEEGNLCLIIEPSGHHHVNERTAHKFPNEKTVELRRRETKPIIVRRAKTKKKTATTTTTTVTKANFLSEEWVAIWRDKYYTILNNVNDESMAEFISFVLSYNQFYWHTTEITDKKTFNIYQYFDNHHFYRRKIALPITDEQFNYYIEPIISGEATSFDYWSNFYSYLTKEELLEKYYSYSFVFKESLSN